MRGLRTGRIAAVAAAGAGIAAVAAVVATTVLVSGPGRGVTSNDYTAFLTKLQANAGLDVNVELDELKATLQADFDAATATPAAT